MPMMMPLTRRRRRKDRTRGFSLIEVLVSLVVVAVGLLGLAGLMIRSQQSEMESYQRGQALTLLNAMYERMNANRPVVNCYGVTDNATGSPYFGVGGDADPAAISAACTTGTATQRALLLADLQAWDAQLKGASEQTATGTNVGVMVNARGCITYQASTELRDGANTLIPGTGVVLVSVSWQGLGNTSTNTDLDCGEAAYAAGQKATRRVVSLTFRVGSIGNVL